MSTFQRRTDPLDRADHARRHHKKKSHPKPVDNSSKPLLDTDLEYLHRFITLMNKRHRDPETGQVVLTYDEDEARDHAMRAVGYACTTPESRYENERKILERIDRAQDTRGTLIGAGHGIAKWVMELAWLYGQKNPKYTNMALKPHMIALGIDGREQPSSGASIHVNVLQQPQELGLEPSAQLVQVHIDARRSPPELPAITDDSQSTE